MGRITEGTLSPGELDQMRNSVAMMEDQEIIALLREMLSSGQHKTHLDSFQIVIDEINARGISADTLGENIMRTTIPRLRKTIRKVILEARNKQYNYGQIRHGDIGAANSDFSDYGAVCNQMLGKGVWPKMGNLHGAGDWSFADVGDRYRFVNTCLQCKNDEGEVIMAVFGVDLDHSDTPTNTSYNVYVVDRATIEKHARNTQEASSSWRDWCSRHGEYCSNTQEIVDTLEDAYDSYLKMQG